MKYRDIQVTNHYNNLQFSQDSLDLFFNTLDSLEKYPISKGELSIAFMDDPAIAKLHDDFMNDPTPTDVITFPADPDLDFAGEICISVDHALSSSTKLSIPFNKELTLYLVHGWLHLNGLDDLTDSDRTKMREAEKEVIEILEKAGAIPDFHIS